MILRKDELEASLHEEHKLIQTGKLKEDNPLDSSEPFIQLCLATRKGDLKGCQEAINAGANINGRDRFDYTPLILASLCGQYEAAQLLLESGALCERDTFQGERCIYSALNDRMRNLLLSYDYSKSTDPLQPFAAHITSLLGREPDTSDITISSETESFRLHKFILAARCPYFRKKLVNAPDATTFKLPAKIPPQAFNIAIRHVYLAELPRDVGGGPGTGFSEQDVLAGIDKISKQLEIQSLWEGILETNDRRQARQNHASEVARGRAQMEAWFQDKVLRHKVVVDYDKADEVKWDRNNSIFADILLRADEDEDHEEDYTESDEMSLPVGNGIPIGPMETLSIHAGRNEVRKKRTSVLFPAHRAMLLRSDYFLGMFSSEFVEAQEKSHLHIVTVDCTPDVLEWILMFLYAEKTDFPLDIALDVLFAADILFIERLKSKAALIISTLGSGTLKQDRIKLEHEGSTGDATIAEDILDPFEVMRAAWELRVPRLETFVARYLAYRLEQYIDLPEFAALITESAARIKNREETDSVEVIDDIRHFLSERFRLRFEDAGITEMLEDEENGQALHTPTSDDSLKENDGKRESDEVRIDAQNKQTSPALYTGEIRTLDGELVSDEFESDALNYQLLLGKIDTLLEKLDLDA